MKEATWWWISALTSAVLIAVLGWQWTQMNRYEIRPTQLVDRAAVDAYLAQHWEDGPGRGFGPLIRIPTGIFIQSMKFEDAADVRISGYIWQRYTKGLNDRYKPAPGGPAGFVLPEQVDSGSDIEPRETYRIVQGNEEVIGWYFEANLRQHFNYYDYPFDHKTVWVRMWPSNFSANVVLTPDFPAYRTTGIHDQFGIEKDIVLGTWDRQNTYFDFKPSCYDTNFGIDHYIGQTDFPELYYNLVIKRKSGNAFIVYVLPLFLVSALLFSTLLIVTTQPELVSRHGFNTAGVLGTCAALFFVVLLAHVQLREQFAGSSIVYLEYFYFLLYGMLVLAAANTYLFSIKAVPWLKAIHYRDNLFPKLLFWPVLLLCMIAITAEVLHTDRRTTPTAISACPGETLVSATDGGVG